MVACICGLYTVCECGFEAAHTHTSVHKRQRASLTRTYQLSTTAKTCEMCVSVRLSWVSWVCAHVCVCVWECGTHTHGRCVTLHNMRSVCEHILPLVLLYNMRMCCVYAVHKVYDSRWGTLSSVFECACVCVYVFKYTHARKDVAVSHHLTTLAHPTKYPVLLTQQVVRVDEVVHRQTPRSVYIILSSLWHECAWCGFDRHWWNIWSESRKKGTVENQIVGGNNWFVLFRSCTEAIFQLINNTIEKNI